MPIRGDRGKARHGGHQERIGHGATGQGGDRGAQGVRGPSGAAVAPQEAQAARTGPYRQSFHPHRSTLKSIPRNNPLGAHHEYCMLRVRHAPAK